MVGGDGDGDDVLADRQNRTKLALCKERVFLICYAFTVAAKSLSWKSP